MVDYLMEHPTNVLFSESQWGILDESFSQILKETVFKEGEETQSIVHRFGVMLYKVCMVLTAIRKYEHRVKEIDVQCRDEDFNLGLSMIKVYIQHSLLWYANLPNDTLIEMKPNGKKGIFFDSLPNNFTWEEACAKGYLLYKISPRTVYNILKSAMGLKKLIRLEHGKYQKAF